MEIIKSSLLGVAVRAPPQLNMLAPTAQYYSQIMAYLNRLVLVGRFQTRATVSINNPMTRAKGQKSKCILKSELIQ